MSDMAASERRAIELLQELRKPVQFIRDGALDRECDCDWAARSALQCIDKLEQRLLHGQPLDESPWGLNETLDDALACAESHSTADSEEARVFAWWKVSMLCELTPEARAADSHTAEMTPSGTPSTTRVRRSPSAERLVSAAVRVLPAEQRSRYRDEYRSELYDIAAAGASRWSLLTYALRLVDRAWVLRAELRDVTLKRVGS
ncbi:hypothetical protein [Micromonospora wenchangensis]|uniref:hypothetical protein n=1 Tax=Micromonospora wenchangensis TaxID=1185415 RepID=UPI00382229ED